MDSIYLYSYVEDPPSAEVAIKIVGYVNTILSVNFEFVEGFPLNQHGYGKIQKRMAAFIRMARNGQRTFILVDLDKTECPPALIREWLGKPTNVSVKLPSKFLFRIAVRETESWLMADRKAIADFLKIPLSNLTKQPDHLDDPKQYLLNLIRRKGRKKWHREMLPQGPFAIIGPAYNEKMCSFARDHWDPERAQDNSPSLKRAIISFGKSVNEAV